VKPVDENGADGRPADGDAPRAPGRGWWIAMGALLLAVVVFYMLRTHFAKAYSDPVGFVGMALGWAQGHPATDRAPVYPVVLYYLMRALGRDWVFLSNLPFVLLLVILSAATGFLAVRRDASAGLHAARIAGLATAVVLLVTRGGLLVELINPFREPLAFSLMLGAVVLLAAGWGRRAAAWTAAGAGLCLGLASSTRETIVLMVVPVGLWVLARMWIERRPRAGIVALLAAGFLGGVAPMMMQNRAHSGSVLVPSYAAEKVVAIAKRQEIEQLAPAKKWDIPIPGMSRFHFRHTAATTFRKLYLQYGPLGLLLLAAGVVRAVRRRNDLILGLYAPAFLLNLLFYCFYRYYKPRYTLAAELFAIPIAAYGLAGLVDVAEAVIRRLRPPLVGAWRHVAPAAMAVVLATVLLPLAIRGDDRTKVWHLARIREHILPHLDRPAFIMGERHVAFYLAWILDLPSFEYGVEFNAIRPDPERRIPVDDRLREQGARSLERFAGGNYYVDDPVFALGRNWLELTPVVSLDSLPVPFERYGRPIGGWLHKVGPWKENRRTLDVDRGVPGPAMLMLDMRRIWDYPGRTQATLRCGPDGPAAPLTNGVQFVELPGTNGGPARLELESDRPLPPAPFALVVKPGDPLRVNFGMAGAHFAWNLTCGQLYPNASLPSDSCLLYDRGTLFLPNYAGPDRDVFAFLRVEFIQQSSYWRGSFNTMTAETASGRASIRLPPERTAAALAVSLGRGEGKLRMVPLTLTTSLPSYPAQNSVPLWYEIGGRYGFVKIYEVRVASLPPVDAYPVTVDLGAGEDAPSVGEGFFGPERSGSATARWTGARAEVRTRLPRAETDVTARWFALPLRKDMKDLVPRFTVNGEAVPPDRVTVVPGGPVWEYRVRLASGQILADDWNRLGVEVPTWSPARDLGAADSRELGLLLDRIEIGPE